MPVGKSSMFDALSRWLPYPVYEFRGGPIDGQHRKVTLIEMGDGMHAPEVWRVQEPSVHAVPAPSVGGMVMNEAVATIATYRFVPWTINTGFYEYVA